jgi:hypothetical protein
MAIKGSSVECRLVGDYMDDAGGASGHAGEVVRPRVVADFVEGADDTAKEFTVLLRDQRTVTVHGQGLKCVNHSAQPDDLGTYVIFSRVGDSEITVAMFRVADVTGIFQGDIRPTRESA